MQTFSAGGGWHFLIIHESRGASGVALFVIHLWTSITAPAVKQKERGWTGIDLSVLYTVLHVRKSILIVPDPDNIFFFFLPAFIILLNRKREMQNNNDDTFPGRIAEFWGCDFASGQKPLQSAAILTFAFFSTVPFKLTSSHDILQGRCANQPRPLKKLEFTVLYSRWLPGGLYKTKAGITVTWKENSATNSIRGPVILEISQLSASGLLTKSPFTPSTCSRGGQLFITRGHQLSFHCETGTDYSEK